MGKLDVNNNKQATKLEDLVRIIAEKYNISDCSGILEMMEKLLNSGRYLFKLDESGKIVSNYAKSDMIQKKYHDTQNKEATEKLQVFAEKVQSIFEILPDEKKYNIEAIRGEFSETDIERNSIWIDLAIEKVLRFHQEDSREGEAVSLGEY